MQNSSSLSGTSSKAAPSTSSISLSTPSCHTPHGSPPSCSRRAWKKRNSVQPRRNSVKLGKTNLVDVVGVGAVGGAVRRRRRRHADAILVGEEEDLGRRRRHRSSDAAAAAAGSFRRRRTGLLHGLGHQVVDLRFDLLTQGATCLLFERTIEIHQVLYIQYVLNMASFWICQAIFLLKCNYK